MNDFDKAVDQLAENIKTPEQIISKRTLGGLIEQTEYLYQHICEHPAARWESWHKQVLGDNLRELKKINQKLGYE